MERGCSKGARHVQGGQRHHLVPHVGQQITKTAEGEETQPVEPHSLADTLSPIYNYLLSINYELNHGDMAKTIEEMANILNDIKKPGDVQSTDVIIPVEADTLDDTTTIMPTSAIGSSVGDSGLENNDTIPKETIRYDDVDETTQNTLESTEYVNGSLEDLETNNIVSGHTKDTEISNGDHEPTQTTLTSTEGSPEGTSRPDSSTEQNLATSLVVDFQENALSNPNPIETSTEINYIENEVSRTSGVDSTTASDVAREVIEQNDPISGKDTTTTLPNNNTDGQNDSTVRNEIDSEDSVDISTSQGFTATIQNSPTDRTFTPTTISSTDER